MPTSWSRFCRAPDLHVEEPHVEVAFGDDRGHWVTVKENDEDFLLSAFVVRQAVVASLPELPVQIWQRNRAVSLAGFRIDRKGRLIGEAWLPQIGVDADEFQLYVRTIAIECDRFEYVLTGRDAE